MSLQNAGLDATCLFTLQVIRVDLNSGGKMMQVCFDDKMETDKQTPFHTNFVKAMSNVCCFVNYC